MNLLPDRVTGKRILLVEDERAVREVLCQLLRIDAHTVVQANNGAEAFALFLGSRFDLVVTDFEMPFVKGDELAAKIKRVTPRQPIVMLTAYARTPGLNNPVDAVVNKPFEASRLRETLNRLLSQPEATGNLQTARRQSPLRSIPHIETTAA